MSKALTEMTLEELWELFPIVLTEHQAAWDKWYAEEEQILAGCLRLGNVRISHIGSTAIGCIWAKPIVDILVELPAAASMAELKIRLQQCGYLCMSEAKTRKSFNKGYTSRGFAARVFHVHLRRCGDNDELYFRDYLKDNLAIAKEYETLKLRLWKQYEHDRDGYTAAKTDFVEKYTEYAKAQYKNRYE